MSPAVSAQQLVDRVLDRLGLVALDRLALLVVVRLLEQRAVAHLDRVGAPGDLDDRRGSALRVGEVLGEALGVDGRRGDHDLEVGTSRQQPLEVAEQEVDVEAALVGLVDDQRVVALQITVALQLGEQDAVGHHLDAALLRRTVGEPHLVADRLPQLGAELLGDPLGDAARGDPARLGVADHAAALRAGSPAPEREADLRQLRGLPRPGLPGHDHDLVVPDRLGDVVTTRRDRQVGREVDAHSAGHSPRRAPGGQAGRCGCRLAARASAFAGVGPARSPGGSARRPRPARHQVAAGRRVGSSHRGPVRAVAATAWHARRRPSVRRGGTACPDRRDASSSSLAALARAAPPRPPRITEASATAITRAERPEPVDEPLLGRRSPLPLLQGRVRRQHPCAGWLESAACGGSGVSRR